MFSEAWCVCGVSPNNMVPQSLGMMAVLLAGYVSPISKHQVVEVMNIESHNILVFSQIII